MFSLILLPKWDCATCTAFHKAERGCEKEPIVPQEMDGEELTRCPRRPLLDDPALFKEAFEVYSWYKRGYFPDQGSYLDQAAAYVQFIDIFERAIAEAKAVKDEREGTRQNVKNPTIVR